MCKPRKPLPSQAALGQQAANEGSGQSPMDDPRGGTWSQEPRVTKLLSSVYPIRWGFCLLRWSCFAFLSFGLDRRS